MTQPIEQQHIHVWEHPLTLDPQNLDDAWCLLNQQEQDRAQRFVYPIHRQRYIAAHAGLRTLLGDYTGMAPEVIDYGIGAHGKPELSQTTNPKHLRFNMSHSGDLAVYAFTLVHDIGIDVEEVKPRDYLALARRYFSAAEYQPLEQLTGRRLIQAFFHVWTQKEAFIKAIGLGLSYPLDEFAVSVHQPAKLIDAKNYDSQQWALRHIDLTNHTYYCALATHQPIKAIQKKVFRLA